MANTLTSIIPKLLASGLLALREQAVMPRIVNGDYGREAAQKGSSIDVPLPSEVAASDVVPGNTPVSPADSSPTVVTIPLSNWKKTNFFLTDKEMLEIDRNRHFMPLQASEAVRSLANEVNSSLHSEYSGIYGWVGTAGTTPFASDASAAVDARKVLHQQRAPRFARRGVLDYDAEANALSLSTFADAEKVMSARVKVEGEIGRKYGLDWFADDGVGSHTKGSEDGAYLVNQTDQALGDKTIAVDTGTGNIEIGDVFTFAGHSQTYVATAQLTAPGTLSFEPGLVAVPADDAAITLKATHVVNLAFQRDAFAFANRPLLDSARGLAMGNDILSITDPQTGISLRLEVTRQNKQTVWEYDILWGVKLVRAALACRIAG